jgi:serine/arginine repetitive matrix protein 2
LDEDDSVLNSIFAKITGVQGRSRVSSDASARQIAREKRRSIYKAMSRPSSGISFTGFDSFDEVRRGFEFSDDRPTFYPPSAATRRIPHRRHESALSIMSVSSYGHVINAGSLDPFDYGLPSLRESSEDMSSVSILMDIDDTFAFMENRPRRRVESDASSFYFRAPSSQQHGQSFTRGHRHRDSTMSVSSQGPPISLYNRSFGTHRRNDSSASSSSVAMSYARHGANSGMAAWTRHRKEVSADSVMSDFSGMHLGRPGLGDKMFNNAADLGPLTSISASPPEDTNRPQVGNRSSFDSIIDDDQRSQEDSLFEKTHYRSSVSSDSVFGDDYHFQNGLLPPNQFRPLSVHSISSIHSPMKEDDTMISVSSILFFCRLQLFINNDICTTDARRWTCSSTVHSISR